MNRRTPYLWSWKDKRSIDCAGGLNIGLNFKYGDSYFPWTCGVPYNFPELQSGPPHLPDSRRLISCHGEGILAGFKGRPVPGSGHTSVEPELIIRGQAPKLKPERFSLAGIGTRSPSHHLLVAGDTVISFPGFRCLQLDPECINSAGLLSDAHRRETDTRG